MPKKIFFVAVLAALGGSILAAFAMMAGFSSSVAMGLMIGSVVGSVVVASSKFKA